mgnify:CR=1 FL=1
MEIDYRDHSLVELAKKVNSRELSAEELIKASLKNIEDVDKEINAFCSICIFLFSKVLQNRSIS